MDQTIPSGVYSALEDANITGSVLYSYNDVNFRWIARDNWTYTLNFAGNLNLWIVRKLVHMKFENDYFLRSS